MSHSADRSTLDGLADLLADAASVHEAAVKVADDDGLRTRLADRAIRLRDLADRLDDPASKTEPGSALRFIDHLRLTVDHLFGDDDEAASTASREAKAGILAFIDDRLKASDLSADTLALLAEVRQHVSTSAVRSEPDEGLKGLPS